MSVQLTSLSAFKHRPAFHIGDEDYRPITRTVAISNSDKSTLMKSEEEDLALRVDKAREELAEYMSVPLKEIQWKDKVYPIVKKYFEYNAAGPCSPLYLDRIVFKQLIEDSLTGDFLRLVKYKMNYVILKISLSIFILLEILD